MRYPIPIIIAVFAMGCDDFGAGLESELTGTGPEPASQIEASIVAASTSSDASDDGDATSESAGETSESAAEASEASEDTGPTSCTDSNMADLSGCYGRVAAEIQTNRCNHGCAGFLGTPTNSGSCRYTMCAYECLGEWIEFTRGCGLKYPLCQALRDSDTVNGSECHSDCSADRFDCLDRTNCSGEESIEACLTGFNECARACK